MTHGLKTKNSKPAFAKVDIFIYPFISFYLFFYVLSYVDACEIFLKNKKIIDKKVAHV